MIIKDPILLELPTPIQTKRLTIRPMMPGDGPQMFELNEESRKLFEEWFHWIEGVKSWQDSERTAREFYAGFILRKTFNFLIFKDKELIGSCSFNDPNFEIPSCSLGYYVRSSLQRNGYIREAVSALTLYGFNQIGFKRITIICDDKNVRSINLAESLGFELELRAKGLSSKPNDNNLRLSRCYVRFDVQGLKDGEVRW